MRDFRLPNVLTRYGSEGDYVVVDMEYAGPDCTEWSLELLDKWDAGTLNQVSLHDAVLQSGSSPRSQKASKFCSNCWGNAVCFGQTYGICFMQNGQYDKMSDMHQIGLMVDSFPVSKPEILRTFVDLLMAKQLSALDALQHPWIVQA